MSELGLTFKDLHSYTTFGLYLKRDARTVLSDITQSTQDVTGFDGTVDFGIDFYQPKTFDITLEYDYFGDYTAMRQQMRKIGGWLYNDKQYHRLVFDDEPDVYYMAKVVKAVTYQQTDAYVLISVEFMCNPPHPFLSAGNTPLTPADVQKSLLWNTATLDGIQYAQDFSVDGNMDFTVAGSVPVLPVIKLLGYIKYGLTLTYGNAKWKYNGSLIYDGIVIDCKNMTVTRISDGLNLFGNVDANDHAFFEFAPGQQRLSVAGVQGDFPNNLTVLLDINSMD